LEVVGATGARTLRVTGIVVVPAIEGGDGIGHGGIVTPDGLRKIDPEAALTNAFFDLRPGADAGATERITRETGMEVGRPDPPTEIVNLDRIRSIPFVVGAVLALLAVLAMSHQLIVSIQHRRGDVALLRAIGADRRWVTSVVHWQATFVACVALLLAVPLGYVGGRAIFRAFVDRIGASSEVTTAPWLVIGASLALIALANVVGGLTARRARKAPPARFLTGE
jgi:predicted lysophospholipase L1 biosynthesis ABC-type transport system permease subunit